MDLPQTSDPRSVLALPSRRRIFDVLAARAGQMSTAEVAAALDLHPNGVRTHLERLAKSGLVERSRVAAGPGRPADRWAVAAGVRVAGDPPTAYRDLVRWLVRAIPVSAGSLDDVEATGRSIGRELATVHPDGAGAALETAFASLGFHPSVSKREDGSSEFCLGNCPYRGAAGESMPVVCTLHRGLTEGLLSSLDPGARMTEFTPRDPNLAGCTVRVTGLFSVGAA